MKITTKTGDKGKTSLYKGKRVSKDDIRIEICGTLDELSACLGLAKSLVKKNKNIKELIASIQKELFIIGSEIACQSKFIEQLQKRIGSDQVENIDKFIQKLEKKKENKLKCFSLSGKNFISAVFDLARTTARRAERRVVTLQRKKVLKNDQIIIYLNRLSDLLYLLARKYASFLKI